MNAKEYELAKLAKKYSEIINKKQSEIDNLKEEKRKKFKQLHKGSNETCVTCRYSWLDNVDNRHTYCETSACKLCNTYMLIPCSDWKEKNDTSKYLEKYESESGMASAFECAFGTYMADASLEKVKKFIEMYED